MKYRTISWFKYMLKARHSGGHGIHSPFLFRLITDVIEDKKQLPDIQLIRNIEKVVLKMLKKPFDKDLVTAFQLTGDEAIPSKKWFKKIDIPLPYAKVIFRLIKNFQPTEIAFIGPTLGITIAVVASASPESTISYLFELPFIYELIRKNLDEKNFGRIDYCEDDRLPDRQYDFIIVNYPDNQELTNRYVRYVLEDDSDGKVLIIRGIHSSREMKVLWEKLQSSQQVNVTLDLFEIGIVFIRKASQKENFVLRY